jgi:hypothetical protein
LDGDIPNIDYIDKKLICGTVTVPARRALKTDTSFSNFKISEAEFHGLNLLPAHSTCILQMIAANGNGSTVSKSFKVDLKFSSHPPLKVYREYISTGEMLLTPDMTITTDYYEITNSLPYTVNLVFRPSRGGLAWPKFDQNSATPIFISADHVEFEPANLEYTGSIEVGYRIKVPPQGSIKIRAAAKIPPVWGTPPKNCSIGPAPSSPVRSVTITATKEPVNSLVLSQGFEFGPDDFTADAGLNPKFSEGKPSRQIRYSPSPPASSFCSY